MASTLRLTGTGGGNTILNGNDTITTDQTFNFPNDGGTLLTGSPEETGDGGSSGSAQVVGYQQGSWTPIVGAGTITSTDVGWTRVGNLVTVWARITDFSSSDASQLRVGALPYPVALPGCGGSVFYSNAAAGADDFTAVYASNDNNVGTSTGGRISFYKSGTGTFLSIQYSQVASNSNVFFSSFYLTDNTDWTPINSATVS